VDWSRKSRPNSHSPPVKFTAGSVECLSQFFKFNLGPNVMLLPGAAALAGLGLF